MPTGATQHITDTYKEQLNEDPLAFVQGAGRRDVLVIEGTA
jgi:hypothetical protein